MIYYILHILHIITYDILHICPKDSLVSGSSGSQRFRDSLLLGNRSTCHGKWRQAERDTLDFAGKTQVHWTQLPSGYNIAMENPL